MVISHGIVIAKLLIIFQTQKFMDKKNINIRQKMFQEGKKLFIHCLMVRIYTETHRHGCVSFDKIRDIIGERIYDGVFAPGFFDYLRLL